MLYHTLAQLKNCTNGVDPSKPTTCLTNLPQVQSDTGVPVFVDLLFGVLAAIAVLIIVIQGIKFGTSQGDPQKAADARKAIIYAVVGLVVAISAEAAIRLVINKL